MQKRPEGIPEDHDAVPFTEFVRPHGERRQRWFWCNKKLARKAIGCIKGGARFGVELLGDSNRVGLYCEFRDETIVTVISFNNEQIIEKVEELINKSSIKLLEILNRERDNDPREALKILEGKENEA